MISGAARIATHLHATRLAPISVYEVYVGSCAASSRGHIATYRELPSTLIPCQADVSRYRVAALMETTASAAELMRFIDYMPSRAGVILRSGCRSLTALFHEHGIRGKGTFGLGTPVSIRALPKRRISLANALFGSTTTCCCRCRRGRFCLLQAAGEWIPNASGENPGPYRFLKRLNERAAYFTSGVP